MSEWLDVRVGCTMRWGMSGRMKISLQRSCFRTFPPASPLMSHRLTVLSSPTLYSSLNAFHPTHATSSLCTLLVDVTLRRMVRPPTALLSDLRGV